MGVTYLIFPLLRRFYDITPILFIKVIGRSTKALTPYMERDDHASYEISSVGREHVGRYRCDVSGKGGSDSHTVELFVKYKPVVTGNGHTPSFIVFRRIIS